MRLHNDLKILYCLFCSSSTGEQEESFWVFGVAKNPLVITQNQVVGVWDGVRFQQCRMSTAEPEAPSLSGPHYASYLIKRGHNKINLGACISQNSWIWNIADEYPNDRNDASYLFPKR